MKYLVIRIGCLCCDAHSDIVAMTSDVHKANDIADKCNLAVFTTKYDFQVFPIQENDEFITEYAKNLMLIADEVEKKRA